MEKIGNMHLYIKDGVGFLKFPELEKFDFVNHAFSTKLGGVSKDEFASMNLSFSSKDKRENVEENYKLFCKAAGFNEETLVASSQVHETFVRKVSTENHGCGIWREQEKIGVDGLSTDTPDTTLVTYYADCVPIYFIDKEKKCIALSHAGWRGTVASMAAKTIDHLVENYGSNIKDIFCAIGPSICRDCYEVDDVVADKVKLLPIDISDVLFPKGNGKYQLDLWQCNKKILLYKGVPEENILVSEVCTRCNSNLLYSHRVMGSKRGGLAAFMSIKK